MSTELIFKAIFFALFFALLAIRILFAWKVRQAGQNSWSLPKEAVKREGIWSIILRLAMGLCLLVLVVVYAGDPDEPGWLDVPLPDWLRGVGAGLGILSLPLLVWVHNTLREYWSGNLQLKDNHLLITQGPYRWVRHPMYAVLMLCFIGLSLASAAWPFLLLAVVTIPFFYRVSSKEEEMMIEQFGDEYGEYKKRAGRFLPQLFANRHSTQREWHLSERR
jgi:protein-S-isoprenylcysteine O-methyltransferase Ste14